MNIHRFAKVSAVHAPASSKFRPGPSCLSSADLVELRLLPRHYLMSDSEVFISVPDMTDAQLETCAALVRKNISAELDRKFPNGSFIRDWQAQLKLYQRELGKRT